MLNRQKILLQILTAAKRPVLRTELTKWSFLLRNDSPSAGGNAFYDFVPYKLGPFSFALYQEAGKLQDQGYIQEHGENAWKLSGELRFDPPKKSVTHDIDSIVRRFKPAPTDALLDYVYERFPAYTANSERKRLASRPRNRPAVFTAGYEGISIDRFLFLLIENGIERLIDVRHNPIARRYGFHKSTLDRLTSRLSIEYMHVPELGIHSSNRQNLDTMDDRKALFKKYEKTTLKTERSAIERVATLVAEKPSVLVCMEADAECCHRSHLAKPVSLATKLPIRHLTAL